MGHRMVLGDGDDFGTPCRVCRKPRTMVGNPGTVVGNPGTVVGNPGTVVGNP